MALSPGDALALVARLRHAAGDWDFLSGRLRGGGFSLVAAACLWRKGERSEWWRGGLGMPLS